MCLGAIPRIVRIDAHGVLTVDGAPFSRTHASNQMRPNLYSPKAKKRPGPGGRPIPRAAADEDDVAPVLDFDLPDG